MDFYQIKTRPGRKKNTIEVYPEYKIKRSKDLMVRGRAFYAIWDESAGLWSTDEYDVQRFIDNDLNEKAEELRAKLGEDVEVIVKYTANYSSRSWSEFKSYVKDISDNSHQLDERLTFSNTEVKKNDYVSKRLPYPLEAGDYSAWDELIGTLYEPDERAKLEWAIGSVVAGDAKDIQKFIVLYGEAGAGKSTVLNIIQKLFSGYYTTFEAKALVTGNNAFAMEMFKTNPLVAIQHDGDLSRIEDNSKLNSIVSHEEMTMNEKFKAGYTTKLNCFLFMATNRPVKITDAKSGIIRRLIDVKPSNVRIPARRYNALMNQIDFQLGAIASHCLDVYKEMGKNFYASYRPLDMIFKTDVFFNFVEDSFEVFQRQNGTTLKAAYAMYKEYSEESGLEGTRLPMYKFREELKNYFKTFYDKIRLDGKQLRSYYEGFEAEKFTNEAQQPAVKAESVSWLSLERYSGQCALNDILAEYPAQYATDEESEKPLSAWANVKSKLLDIDTTRVHYVRVPKNLIVIDFDLKNQNGEKDTALNIEAASKWPPTYAELSKGGHGVHLHYFFDGDPDTLSINYAPGIEVKVYRGKSSLRRKLSLCNSLPVATISSGLPLKEHKMVDIQSVKSEKSLRDLVYRNLMKEIHPGTKPSIDFISKILDDAYSSKLKYDISDMHDAVLAFASGSSHHSDYCIKQVQKMKFRSDEHSQAVDILPSNGLVFFDVEVFPNLFLVNWKYAGDDKKCVRMVNPKSSEIEDLMKMRLIGFNCRRYDNHILYARWLGYSNEDLYRLSQRIINSDPKAMFGEAYNLSYTDVWDFASKKQSLKKWEIELGIHHQELGLPWDQPVSEDLWDKVAEYCDNDVVATEAVFNACQADWTARKILADISKILTGSGDVNDTTNQLTTRIILRGDRDANKQFVYPNLAEEFPGYEFDAHGISADRYTGKVVSGKSIYHGEDPGEGGRVYAKPGMYRNVKTFDIASMHPSSLIAENGFGKYTQNFKDLLDIRLAIKHKKYDEAKKFFNGALSPYLTDPDQAKALSQALKIAINSVYGLTSASFDNPLRDPRNIDNWVAKRGALFMIDLQLAVEKMGANVIHIKTDSIKIVNPTEEVEDFILTFGRKYGYSFEIEAEYERICLVNQAVYIAKYYDDPANKRPGMWTATGTEFQHPYVFKTLFSKEPLTFTDLCETKTVTGALYLDYNEDLPDVKDYEKMKAKLMKQGADQKVIDDLSAKIAEGHDYKFVGKAGRFTPVKPGNGGAELVRVQNDKYYAVSGTSGYRWKESETMVDSLNIIVGEESPIDMRYFEKLAEEAKAHINEFGDFEMFVSGDLFPIVENEVHED